jgi:hypothetical protein
MVEGAVISLPKHIYDDLFFLTSSVEQLSFHRFMFRLGCFFHTHLKLLKYAWNPSIARPIVMMVM